MSNWREGVLNIAAADPDLMIESVQVLLKEGVINEIWSSVFKMFLVLDLSKSNNCNEKYPEIFEGYKGAILLDLQRFSDLVIAIYLLFND